MTQQISELPASDYLKQATSDLHRSLESHPVLHGLLSPNVDRLTYVPALLGFTLFNLAWERGLRQSNVVPDDLPIHIQQASGDLVQDLQDCGVNPSQLAVDDHVPGFDYVTDLASFCGALYVVEGSALGGLMISRHINQHSDLPTAFFTRGGDLTIPRWHECKGYLDRTLLSHDQREAAQIAACQTFKTVKSCLDQAESLSDGLFQEA